MVTLARQPRTSRGPASLLRRITAPVAIALVLASLSGLMHPASAHPTVPSTVFDLDQVRWSSVRDMSSTAFSDYFDEREDDGYMVTDLEVDVIGGQGRVGAVFQRNTDGRAWRSRRALSSAAFNRVWRQARRDGLRPVDQETYVVDGRRRWAGVWVENREGYDWVSFRGVTGAEFRRHYRRYRHHYMPIDVEMYQTSAGLRYAGVWVENAEHLDWRLLRGLTSSSFADVFATYADGFRMLDVESELTSAGQRYAGIWVENRNGRAWLEQRDMTARRFANEWRRHVDEGYRLVDYEKYPTRRGARYAAIWRQNSDRPSWSLRPAVDARVQAELDDHDVPGMSVVIARDNEILYRRGFGHADVASGTWLDSEHVMRTASVAKPVAGVLTMRLVEQGEIALNDLTGDHLPPLPAHHTHTLGQLVSNRGCVRDYDQGDNSFAEDHYVTALAAASEFWDDPLVCNPGWPHYSTHGFTILGAALEIATGVAVDDLVRTELTEPYDLRSLRAEDRDDTSVRRTRLYAPSRGGNVEIEPDDISWKVLGGGLEATTLDLARFGIKLADGQILSQASLNTMWTPPNGTSVYAHGWATGLEEEPVSGTDHRVVAHNGAQTGSETYLRVYPDDELVIAIMSNRRGSHDPRVLGRDLGARLLTWIDN